MLYTRKPVIKILLGIISTWVLVIQIELLSVELYNFSDEEFTPPPISEVCRSNH